MTPTNRTERRPACPECGHPIDRMQPSYGATALYPCGHWLADDEAEDLAHQHHNRETP